MRQRRQEATIELRKNKKDDQIMKRRNIEVQEPTSPLQENNAQSPNAVSMPLDEIMTSIQSTNLTMQHLAVQTVRKMLSREKNPPIETIITLGLVPILVKFLDDFDK
jgi:importin subunit alpha-2